jgi:hypothetical protein
MHGDGAFPIPIRPAIDDLAEPAEEKAWRVVTKRWLVRAPVFAVLVSLFWLIGWGVVDAWLGWWMAGIGGVGLLPYLLILDWK